MGCLLNLILAPFTMLAVICGLNKSQKPPYTARSSSPIEPLAFLLYHGVMPLPRALAVEV